MMGFFASILFAFVVSFLAIGFIKPLAVKVGLVDVPIGRKLHQGHVPLIGGVSIYLSILTTSLFFIPQSQVFNLYILSASMLLFVGVLDDRYDIPVRYRFIAQILVGSMMIFGAGFYIENLGNLFGIGVVKLGFVGVFVTLIAIIGAINAFNMVDGIDGLAGMLSMVSFASLAFLLSHAGSDWYLLPALFIAAIVPYLMANLGWPSRVFSKIFMGDAGSMLIGLTVVWLLVIGVNDSVNAFRPVTALYIVAVPLMDMAAIMYRRIKKGDSPFRPDRDHLHHIFIRAGFSSQQALVIISISAACIALLGVVSDLYAVPELVMLLVFLLIFLLYCYVIQHIWQVLSWVRKFS
jgi:UDP-GlcNAc:undecaprenyl-phosphate/decaprenyl-phosphate GlcNAc-1-phosphate transferase